MAEEMFKYTLTYIHDGEEKVMTWEAPEAENAKHLSQIILEMAKILQDM